MPPTGTAAYDAIAEWYDQRIQAGALLHDPVWETLRPLLPPDLPGQQVCDLACGQGHITRALAGLGAQVVGIDLSANLLERARQYETVEPRGIHYEQDDACTLGSVSDAAFEGVVSTMALMDITDLSAVFQSVGRILKPSGWFVFVITHPCFQLPPEGYFAEGFWRSDNPDGVRGKVGAHHRTLSWYLNALADAGFRLARMHEPRVGERPTPPLLAVHSNR